MEIATAVIHHIARLPTRTPVPFFAVGDGDAVELSDAVGLLVFAKT